MTVTTIHTFHSFPLNSYVYLHITPIIYLYIKYTINHEFCRVPLQNFINSSSLNDGYIIPPLLLFHTHFILYLNILEKRSVKTDTFINFNASYIQTEQTRLFSYYTVCRILSCNHTGSKCPTLSSTTVSYICFCIC